MKKKIKVKDKIHSLDSIKIAPFRKNIKKTRPHKHNKYFEIVYLTEGTGQHTIDSKTFEIQPSTIFLIRKEQVHFWDIKTEPSGFVLIIKKDFVETCLDAQVRLLLNEISAFICLSSEENGIVDQLFNLLYEVYAKQQPCNRIIIEGLLKALLAKLLESKASKAIKQSNKSSIFKSYIGLLSESNKLVNNVAHYAQMLHTTPQNLNTICRKENDQSAAEILAKYIIREAKRLLLYSDFTIKEVAFSLAFKDNSHFTKYFKRHTGITPNSFRSS